MPVDHRRPLRLLAAGGVAALLATGLAVATPAARRVLALHRVRHGHPGPGHRLGVDPSPLQAGRNVTVTLRGSLSEKVTGGTYDARVQLSRRAPAAHQRQPRRRGAPAAARRQLLAAQSGSWSPPRHVGQIHPAPDGRQPA